MSKNIETDKLINSSVTLDHDFRTGIAGEEIVSNTGFTFGYNQLTILTRPTQPMTLELFTGFEPRIQKGTNINIVPSSNNEANFQRILNLSLTADQHFSYQVPVDFSHFFIKVTCSSATVNQFNLCSFLSHSNPNPMCLRDSNIDLHTFTQSTRPISDFDLDVKDGNLEGLAPFNFKAHGDFSNNERLLTFAPYQDITDIVQATTANRAFVVASTSTSDTNAQAISGARVLRMTGLNETGSVASIDVNMLGTTGVLTAGDVLSCVNAAEVITVGTLEENVGRISADEHPVNDHVFQINAGENRAFMPYQHIALSKQVFLHSIKIDYFCGEMCKLNIYKVNYKTTTNNIKSVPVRKLLHTFHLLNNGQINYKCDDIFTDRDVMIISAQSVVNQAAFSQGNMISCEVSGYEKTLNFTDVSS